MGAASEARRAPSRNRLGEAAVGTTCPSLPEAVDPSGRVRPPPSPGRTFFSTRGETLSSLLLIISTLTVLTVLYRLAATFLNGNYVCPGCGARSADRHAGHCPWSR
jgi:hypothetical protein